ncbi:MAG: copper chaperone PCu(A)C [Pseudomonadota bacterium]|nr:copper chaperone PCu(A)C [Pseudomonadota bacterium]
MKPTIDRRRVIQAGLAWGLTLRVPTARACEFVTANFKVIHPWARATGPDATTAAISMIFQEVSVTDRLIGASTPVAERAEMGGASAAPAVNFVIAAGQSSALNEQGTYLKLVGLKLPLYVAGSYPLTLVFEKVGPIETNLSIDYARFS